MFEYERSLPLGFKELSIIRKDGYTVRDVSYLSPHGGNVPAYLVVPNKEENLFQQSFFCTLVKGIERYFYQKLRIWIRKV